MTSHPYAFSPKVLANNHSSRSAVSLAICFHTLGVASR